MKTVLVVVAFALGVAGLVGCSSAPATNPSAEANGAPPPEDTGAGQPQKKSPRIPAAPK